MNPFVFCELIANFGEMMTLLEAIGERHSVRRYRPEAISETSLVQLREAVERANSEAHLHIQLVTGEKLVLLAQQLGLNSCWAGLSYIALEYTRMDKGIARLHFEIGAGTEHFRWEDKDSTI